MKLKKTSISGSTWRLNLIHSGDREKKNVHRRDKLMWANLIGNVMMFHPKLEIEDLLEFVFALYGDYKCQKIFQTPEELLAFIHERCAYFLSIEEQQEGGEMKIIVKWKDLQGKVIANRNKNRLIELGNTDLLETPIEENVDEGE